jgi:ABC-type nitrate/sulfonate/bicarbonate transport system ATPase subunit
VSKSYRLNGRSLAVLQGIDLEALPGSFTSIVGASGCGKSTLLRLIVGLDADYEGEILLDGRPIRAPGLERGMVFQEHRLFPWLTVNQNVALGLSALERSEKEKRTTIAEHIRLVGLEGFERAYPYQLSGGMAQRAAIARALVSKPSILLLDEPLGALDALTRLHLQNELQRLWRAEGVTMILVTHDIEEAVFLGQQVVVMDSRPGRIRRRLRVELPYPRARAHPDFLRIKQDLLDEFHLDGEDRPRDYMRP